MSARLPTGDRAIGAAVLLTAAVAVALILTGTVLRFFDGTETTTITAKVRDAQQIRIGDAVRIDGVDSGVVSELDLDADRKATTITMEMDEESGPIYRDARLTLRFKTVLGGAFFLDLERGSPDQPQLGGAVIPASRTARQVEVDDITDVLKGDARAGLRALPGSLSEALRDPDVPKRLLDTVTDAAPGIADGLGGLRGEDPDRDLQALVRSSARTVKALDRPRDVRSVVEGGAIVLQTTAARADDIRRLLRTSPDAGVEIDEALTRLRPTLDRLDPLVADLRRAAPRLRPTFAALRPVLRDADTLLDRAVPLLRALRPTAASLASTARVGRDVVEGLAPSVERADDVLVPMLNEVDPITEKSTAVMIGGTFAGLGAGAVGQQDLHGHFIRFPATAGSSPVQSLPCQLYLNNPDAAELVRCNDLSDALQAMLTYNPLGEAPELPAAKSRRTEGGTG